MAIGPSTAALKQLQTLFQAGTVGGLTDGQLLDRFVQRRDEAAFAALVERHGPMVLRVCRSRLGDRHDAEDAFQATFLVLAQKAPSIRHSEAVAGWLLGVAGRVAARARSAGRRRSSAEQKAVLSVRTALEESPSEPWAELYDELERLPEKYRLPLVLCYLEGLTYEQAAMRLACPVRTVQTRLARGRERLRGRLARRGLAPSVALRDGGWIARNSSDKCLDFAQRGHGPGRAAVRQSQGGGRRRVFGGRCPDGGGIARDVPGQDQSHRQIHRACQHCRGRRVVRLAQDGSPPDRPARRAQRSTQRRLPIERPGIRRTPLNRTSVIT